jgi:hypothetical protein
MDEGVVKTEERKSHVQNVRFVYRYDTHGNWTERIVSQRMEPNADERSSNIERRAITYRPAEQSPRASELHSFAQHTSILVPRKLDTADKSIVRIVKGHFRC